MLFRIFKLKEFEAKLHLNAFAKEREEFLSVIASEAKQSHALRHPEEPKGSEGSEILRFAQDDFEQIKRLLSLPLSQHQLPDPETGLLFERMVSQLPQSFKYETYPNVTLFIGHLILQSELSAGGGSAFGGKGERLLHELEDLTDQISLKLADTPETKKLLTLLKDYRLLKRLFALELTPEDYETILNRNVGAQFIAPSLQGMMNHAPTGDLRPSHVIHRLLSLNRTKRVRDLPSFFHLPSSTLDELDSLFEKALQFYRGVKARDEFMLQNIEARLRETGENKAVAITGGFHAGPFTEYFKKQGYNYALIAPKITTAEGREAYINAALQKAPIEFIKAARETIFSYQPQAALEGGELIPAANNLIRSELRVVEKAGAWCLTRSANSPMRGEP